MREWYAVRRVFRWNNWDGQPYEERITLWQAENAAEAIELSEAEAARYAQESDLEDLGLAQAYTTGLAELRPGAEVFSLLRDSPLPPQTYVDTFFDTGGEHRNGDQRR